MPCQTEGFLHISDGDCVAFPWFEFKKKKNWFTSESSDRWRIWHALSMPSSLLMPKNSQKDKSCFLPYFTEFNFLNKSCSVVWILCLYQGLFPGSWTIIVHWSEKFEHFHVERNHGVLISISLLLFALILIKQTLQISCNKSWYFPGISWKICELELSFKSNLFPWFQAVLIHSYCKLYLF